MKNMKIALSGEGQYCLLVDAVIDYAIYMLDIFGVVTSWSPAAQRFKGYEASEIIGQNFSYFYIDEDKTAGLPQLALSIGASIGRFKTEGWRVSVVHGSACSLGSQPDVGEQTVS